MNVIRVLVLAVCGAGTMTLVVAGCFGSDNNPSPADAGFDGSHPIFDAGDTGSPSDAQDEDAAVVGDAPFDGGVVDAAPVVLTSGSVSPYGIAVDDTSVYWTEFISGDAGTLMKVSKNGGAPVVLATGTTGARGLALDPTHVYWAQGNPPAIMKANLDGSNAQTLDYPDYAYGGGVLSVNGSSVYTAAGSVNSVPIGGGAAVALIPGPGAVTCAIDDTNVYWVHSSSPAEIHKAPLNGDASVTVLTNQHTLATDYQNLALDDASVYWPNSIEHTLNKVTKDGVTQTVLMAMDAGSGPSAVVTDGVNLYWLQYGPAALMKMPVGGGAPVTMVTGAAVATPPSNTPLPPLAVDGTSVYWLNPPAIMKVAKN